MADLEIATHIQCLPEDLSDLFERFAQCAQPLEPDTNQLRVWLESIRWSPDGSGFGELGAPLLLYTHGPEHTVLTAKPHVLGYTASAIPGVKIPWVEIGLVLENGTEDYAICVSGSWGYPRAFGRAVLEVMWRLSQCFLNSGVYFNDGPSVDRPWKALINQGKYLWDFDLAIIPDQLAPRFISQPGGYARVVLPGGIAIARLAAWVDNPLDSASGLITDFT